MDVFITTYNEDISILRATALGCLAMERPHETYLLDDGQRLEVERLAVELGCHYLTRPANTHAKAGNINNALSQTDGQFIAVFDADQVPHPDFLVRTLGFFQDDRLALVQTPQDFYNLDSVQHVSDPRTGDVWHEQTLFYSVIQPGKDRMNAAFWCGSNALLRRSALEGVGGVAVGTVTEDIHTSMRLHQAGWKSRYLNRTLATGIAPADYGAFLTQRLRWAQGAMQLLRSDNPLLVRGLNWRQRINYWASMSTYFEAHQKLVLLIVPLVVLTTGTLPMRSMGFEFLIRFAPYFLLAQLANSLLSRGRGRYFLTEQFNVLKSTVFVWASIALLWGRPIRFRVTPKSVTGGLKRRRTDLTLLSPYFALVGLTVFALTWAYLRVLPSEAEPGIKFGVYITGLWALYNVGIIGMGAGLILKRRYRRSTYRFPVEIPLRFAIDRKPQRYTSTVSFDLNAEGVGFLSLEELDPGTPLRAVLELPDGPLTVAGVARHSRIVETAQGRRYGAGMLFTTFPPGARDRLLSFLFGPVTSEQEAALERALGRAA
ncbi:MAG: glycosyltransferase family 2 protein [Dehalococcoidia bacterium]